VHIPHPGLRNEDVRAGVINVGCNLPFDARKDGVEHQDERERQSHSAHGDHEPGFILKEVVIA
jgi:hypothetical protein